MTIFLAKLVITPDTPFEPPELRRESQRSLRNTLACAFVSLSTIISVMLLALLASGPFKPAPRAFSVAPQLHVFIYPYRWYQDIAVANYGYTSLIDMKYVQSTRRFDAFGIHILLLEWPRFYAISVRMHLLYPILIFALPLSLALYHRICRNRAKKQNDAANLSGEE